MTTTIGATIRANFATLVGVAAALTSQLPGISFFTDHAPPAFGVLTLMTSGLTLALFVWVFSTAPAQDRHSKIGMAVIVSAVVLAIIYSVLLSWLTVTPPPGSDSTDRFQIGFGLWEFSLTPDALAMLKNRRDVRTPQDLMLAFGAFRPDGARLVWSEGTITAAWLLLSGIFVATYSAWAYGLACMAWKLSQRVQPE